jgi:hypothetical protein
VFSEELLDTYIGHKRKNEADAVRLRPHPYEFALYYDISRQSSVVSFPVLACAEGATAGGSWRITRMRLAIPVVGLGRLTLVFRRLSRPLGHGIALKAVIPPGVLANRRADGGAFAVPLLLRPARFRAQGRA